MFSFRLRWICLWCGANFAFAFTVAATSIVAVRTQGRVVIAADGKVAHLDGRPGETRCKILKVGEVYFAAVGLESTFYKIDPYSSARSASLGRHRVSEIANSFAVLEKAKLARALPLMKRYAPDIYEEFHTNPEQVVFVGIENGSPIWIALDFWSTETSGTISVEPRKITCPGQCADGDYLFLGRRRAIAEAKEHNPRLTIGDPEVVTASLVGLEIEGEPEAVGPPISELRLENDGAHWIRAGACSSIKARRNRGQE